MAETDVVPASQVRWATCALVSSMTLLYGGTDGAMDYMNSWVD